jgi:hypothetical protein
MLPPGVQPTAEQRAEQFAPVQPEFAGLAPEYQALHEDALSRQMTEISTKIGDSRAIFVQPFPDLSSAEFAVEQAIRDTGIPCQT